MTREEKLYNQIKKAVENDQRIINEFQCIIYNGINTRNVSGSVQRCVSFTLKLLFKQNLTQGIFLVSETDIVVQAVYDAILEVVDDMLILMDEE